MPNYAARRGFEKTARNLVKNDVVVEVCPSLDGHGI
jgi:hypothetical protein